MFTGIRTEFTPHTCHKCGAVGAEFIEGRLPECAGGCRGVGAAMPDAYVPHGDEAAAIALLGAALDGLNPAMRAAVGAFVDAAQSEDADVFIGPTANEPQAISLAAALDGGMTVAIAIYPAGVYPDGGA